MMERGPQLAVVVVVGLPFKLKFHFELSSFAILELPFLARIKVLLQALDS
jgi:hypothetical protein